jgi:hypothetical protein
VESKGIFAWMLSRCSSDSGYVVYRSWNWSLHFWSSSRERVVTLWSFSFNILIISVNEIWFRFIPRSKLSNFFFVNRHTVQINNSDRNIIFASVRNRQLWITLAENWVPWFKHFPICSCEKTSIAPWKHKMSHLSKFDGQTRKYLVLDSFGH